MRELKEKHQQQHHYQQQQQQQTTTTNNYNRIESAMANKHSTACFGRCLLFIESYYQKAQNYLHFNQ